MKGWVSTIATFCRPAAPSRRRVGGPGLQRWFMEAPRLTKCRCSAMRDHTKLRAFELADQLAVAIYKTTRSFPREEMFGLTSQLRRLSLIHISEPTRLGMISYAVFCLNKK